MIQLLLLFAYYFFLNLLQLNISRFYIQTKIQSLKIQCSIIKLQMSDDQNYEEEQVKQDSEMKNLSQQQIELNKVIQSILTESQKSQPLFPSLLSKKLCEANGLQCSEDTFFNIMSNVVEYSLNEILNFNKEVKSAGKYKKEGNDNQLRTLEIQKIFEAKNIHIAKPRCYPEIALQTDKNTQSATKQSSHQ